MKGPNCDEEIAAVREQFGDWLDLAFDEDYTLPDSRDRRRLVVWRRNERPSPPVAEPDRIALNAGPRHRREVIHSRDNDKFKATRTLHTSRGIKKQGQALVSGLRVVNEYLSRHPELCRAVLVPETDGEDLELPTTPEGRAFQEHWAETDLPLRVFGRELFRELDLIGTGPPLLLIEAPVLDRYDSAPSPPDSAPGCTLFLPMGDPENLGAALRSAAAFEVSECVLLEEAAHPYHPRALRAAAGATPRLPLKKGPSVAGLAATVPDLFVLDPDGDDIRNVEFPPRFGLLAGPEEGLGATGGARRVRVPASDAVESLNTTVALSIALYILKERGVL